MPTYEYACNNCGHEFEIVQSFSDDALTTCPECGGPLRKVFGSVGIVFKGSGFYKNDSRGSSPGKKAEPSSTTTPESTKPDASSTTKETKETKETKSSSTSDSKSATPTPAPKSD